MEKYCLTVGELDAIFAASSFADGPTLDDDGYAFDDDGDCMAVDDVEMLLNMLPTI